MLAGYVACDLFQLVKIQRLFEAANDVQLCCAGKEFRALSNCVVGAGKEQNRAVAVFLCQEVDELHAVDIRHVQVAGDESDVLFVLLVKLDSGRPVQCG